MKLRLFKKKSARNENATTTTKPSSLESSLRTCDDTTASGDSTGASVPSAAESLARNGKWDAFMRAVNNSDADDWNASATPTSLHSKEEDASSSSSASSSIQPNTTTPLHIMLSHRAPVDVVDSMITLLKEKFNVLAPEEFQDAMGRTPLHIAVENHCTEDVAERLLNGEGLVMPAVLRDNEDRTPLLVAAFAPIVKPAKKKRFAPNRAALDKWNKRQIIQVLLKHYPEGAHLTDCNGKTALEYARENQLHDTSISQLTRAVEVYAPTENDSDSAVTSGPDDADFPEMFPLPNRRSSGFIPKFYDSERDAARDGDDVSTIGYNEAEMFNVEEE